MDEQKTMKELKQEIVKEICDKIKNQIAFEVFISVNDTKIELPEMQDIVNRAIKKVKIENGIWE